MLYLVLGSSLIAAAIALWILPRNCRWPMKLLLRAVTGILMCALVLALLMFVIGEGMCGRCEFPPVSSKDGKFAAKVSEEDCGAVDSFHSSVELWQNRQGISARLFGKHAHSTTIFTVGNDPRLIDLSWKDDRTLLIHYPNDSRYPEEFSCQSKWSGIRIDCVGYIPDYKKSVGEMPPVQRWVW